MKNENEKYLFTFSFKIPLVHKHKPCQTQKKIILLQQILIKKRKNQLIYLKNRIKK
jgi:hypothetical protein